jgi:diguanylate cyclase (GGDEF)-like protein
MDLRPPSRITLRTKLFISCVGVGALVAALLLLGNHIIRDASQRLEGTLTAQVRPLAQLNRLQAQISRIRVLEVEIPRLTDLFAVSDQLELLKAEIDAFDRDFGVFVAGLKADKRPEAASLEEQWRRYEADLKEIVKLAQAMQLSAVQRVSTFESAARVKAISRILRQLAESTEAGANQAFDQAVARHGDQRTLFVAVSVIGLLVFVTWIVLLARSLSGRVSRLRDAAMQVAEGRRDSPIVVVGRDELADLGGAFNTMQEKVHAREQALRDSHAEMESRVQARTRELYGANERLTREIDERLRVEERILHQAQHDALTGLPNRILAMDRLAQAILQAQRAHSHVVLIFLDLDDFKRINDSLGHHMGDALLVQAAGRLRDTVRAEDTVARQGGDEFLIIIGGLATPHDAENVAEKIVGAFGPSFQVGESDVVVSPSMGLAVYPFDGEDVETLLRNADLAMYDAKEQGRNTYRYFNQKVHESSVMRLAIEHRLRGALPRGELRLFYQPLVSTATRKVIGAEALLRWQSPDYGLVAPDHFMAVAEHTGLIVDIGEWVLSTACAQARRWRDLGWEGFRIGVNVSPRQFRGRRLLNCMRECLERERIPPSCLQIEVTEGLLIRNQPEVREILGAFNAEGVLLALDDFGTGYSSLSYLKRFPFDILKIDREFVRDLASDPDDRALVTAAIRMGKELGLIVVAEGVETEEQLAILAEQECDVIQGFVIGEAIGAEFFEERWIAPLLATAGAAKHAVGAPRARA